MRKPLRRSSIVVLALISLSCQRKDDPPSTRPPLSEQGNGVSESENGRIDWPQSDSSPSVQSVNVAFGDETIVTPTPSLTLGTGALGPDDILGPVRGIAVDRLERIYVLDPYSYRVRVYSSVGTHVRDIGRQGGGPGELQRPHAQASPNPMNGLAISHDTLVVLDIGLRAFDTTGAYLGSSAPQLDFNNAAAITATPEGIVVTSMPSTSSVLSEYKFTLFNFEKRDSLKVLYSVFQHFHEYGDPLHRAIIPHAVFPFHVTDLSTMLYAPTDSFRIDVRSADGRLAKVITARVPRVRLREGDVSDFAATHVERLRAAVPEMSSDQFKREWETPVRRDIQRRPVAAYREAIGVVISSSTGELLVSRPDLSERPYLEAAPGMFMDWSLISADGKAVARVRLPSGFAPKVFQACALYGLSQDDAGAPLVVRYDLSNLRLGGC